MSGNDKRRLRSQRWFGGTALRGFIDRSWTRIRSIPDDQFDGRPVIGICNTWSELTPCNSHFRTIAQHVRDGVLDAGGFPMEFPVMSTGETYTRPTAMLHRNLASMDVEESLRSNPLDGVVLLMGCDKTTPALLMGAASVNLPAIGVSGGPMMNGNVRGQKCGVKHVWNMSDDYRAGRISEAQVRDFEVGAHRSIGHCNIMGTASTMGCMVEALGVGLIDNASIPAVDVRRNIIAREAGRRIVELVKADVRINQLLTREAFENAIRVNAAIGGSTNAVIHLIALARRVGIDLSLDDWDGCGRGVPTLVNLQPSGEHLMQDFHEAGGLPVVLRELGEHGLLHRAAMTVTGKSIWENNSAAICYDREVIRPFAQPLQTDAAIAVLRGNLCPNGAVIKPSAASRQLLQHRGRAVVFENQRHMKERLADAQLEVDASSILVLKNCGPRGFPGMPELGNIPIPTKLLKAGVSDMVRISDSRMSGTAFGAVVLHIAPEAAVGGPLALVRDGDEIELDVPNRRLNLHVSAAELERRRDVWIPPQPTAVRGYGRLYIDHVNQAHEGADFDFLVGSSGSDVPPGAH